MNKKLFLIGLVMLLLASFVSAYFEEDFNNLDDWTTNSGTWTIDGGRAEYTGGRGGNMYKSDTTVLIPDSEDWEIEVYHDSYSVNILYALDETTPTNPNSAGEFYIAFYTFQGASIGIRYTTGSGTLCDLGSATVSAASKYHKVRYSTDNDTLYFYESTTGTSAYSYVGSCANIQGGVAGIDGSSSNVIWYNDHNNNNDPNNNWIDYLYFTDLTPVIPKFELTASNLYNSSSITDFNATFTNSTDTETITTTNGSIFLKYNEEELYGIDINASNYFPYSITNYNLSIDLNASLYQAELRVTANDSVFKTGIGNFSITINDSTNFSSNGSLPEMLFKVNGDTYSYNAQHTNYTGNVTGTFTVPALSLTNETVEFSRSTQNLLRFNDQRTGEPLENGNLTIVYPNGYEINLTTNASGHINFSVYGNESVGQSGTYSITFLAYEGFITPVTFPRNIDVYNYPLSENISISDTSIIVNVYDRSTLTLLDQPANISIIGYANAMTSNGTYNFNNITVPAGDLVIKVVSDGYVTEQSTATYTGQENATINIYMLNATETNAGFLFVNVIDEYYRVQPNSIVELYEYDESTLAYIKVSEVRTNINGESTFAIELNTKTYYLKAFKTIDGEFYSVETTPEIIKTDEEVRNLVMRLTEQFNIQPSDYLTIDISETFVNNISTIFIDFSTVDNFVTEVCVQYYIVTGTTDTSVYLQCVESSSAYSATPILLNRSNQYRADVYQLYNGINYPLRSYRYDSINDFGELFDSDNLLNYVIFFLWILIIVFMFKTEKIMMLLIFGLILSWTELTLAPTLINVAGSILKTVIIIFMYVTATKKEDLG